MKLKKLLIIPMIFYGALSTVAIDFKIPIIPTPSAMHTAKLLVSLCSRTDLQRTIFEKNKKIK